MQEQLIALLGHPVSHSKSPQMQNAAFKKLNLPFRYMAFNVEQARLGDAISGLKAIGFRGANVTIPHKITIQAYLDEITPLAKKIGAVNTLYYHNGQLIGDNTDGEGYLASLLQEFPRLNPKMLTVGIIGAGGAARAVAFTLAQHGIQKLYLTNRNEEKGIELASALSEITDAEFVSITQFQKVTSQIDLLIHTTPIGMSPNVDASFIPMDWIHPNMIVSDLIYNPSKTRLLHEAEQKGASIHNGMGMLVYQGAIAFERWTGEQAPVEVMRAQLLQSLQLS